MRTTRGADDIQEQWDSVLNSKLENKQEITKVAAHNRPKYKTDW